MTFVWSPLSEFGVLQGSKAFHFRILNLQTYFVTLDIALPEHGTYIEQFDFGSRSLCVFVSAM